MHNKIVQMNFSTLSAGLWCAEIQTSSLQTPVSDPKEGFGKKEVFERKSHISWCLQPVSVYQIIDVNYNIKTLTTSYSISFTSETYFYICISLDTLLREI